MEEFEPFDPKWYRELKQSREEFYNVENIIESAKFKYERELNFPKWLFGVGVAILFSAGILNLSSITNLFLKFIATWGFAISAIGFIIVLFMIIILDNRQKIAMAYLYREKDKQEKKK